MRKALEKFSDRLRGPPPLNGSFSSGRCQQKYCECYGNSFKCTDNCICEECENGKGSSVPGAPLSAHPLLAAPPGVKGAGDGLGVVAQLAAAIGVGGAGFGGDVPVARAMGVDGLGGALSPIKVLRGCR